MLVTPVVDVGAVHPEVHQLANDAGPEGGSVTSNGDEVADRRAAVRRSLLTAFMMVRASSRFCRRRLAPAAAFCRPTNPRVTNPRTTVMSATVTMSSTSVIPRSDEPSGSRLRRIMSPRGAHHWIVTVGVAGLSGLRSCVTSVDVPDVTPNCQLPYGSAAVMLPDASVAPTV